MSRRQPVDNSATVSLFPFLAVLLCTMGALLVVLVAVSRSARNRALQRAASQQTVVEVADDPATREELDKVDKYVTKLQQLRTDAEAKLREDQLRLGQLESHMRRLQDQLQKLVLAANELDSLENEHYDDRKQAEREIDRLNKMIAENETAINDLRRSGTKKRTYAVLPYEGPNGTYRRPIYVECCKEGVILQPEGVVISREDLQPPLGSGNALAAALRAARDHYVQMNPGEGQNRDAEPYPMVLIRPDGAYLFAAARRAIEAGDFDFGFEPVEKHWGLKFGTPDPQLANSEQQAIEQARARQTLLAAAAPRAYRNREMASSGQFEFREDTDDMMTTGFGRKPRVEGQPAIAVPSAMASTGGETSGGSGGGRNGSSGGEPGDGPALGDSGGAAGSATSDGEGDSESSDGNANQDTATTMVSRDAQRSVSNRYAAGASPSESSSPNRPSDITGGAGSGSSELNSQSIASSNGASVSAASSSSGDQQVSPLKDFDPHQQAKANFAAPRTNAKAVAVRRMISVVVRESQMGIVSDESRPANANLTGKTIEFKGDTVESVDEFVKAVQAHVESWGIAGDGLYWKPVLELHIGPDGQRRAEDLQRLLKNSDVEVTLPSTATNSSQGPARATR